MRSRRRRGSLLIEAVIAMSVLAVVVAAFTEITATKSNILLDAQERTQATRWADAEIGRLRALSFEDLPRENNRSFQVQGLNNGRGRVTVKDSERGLKEVRVKVTWTLRNGADDTLFLTTLVGPGDPK